MARVTEAEVLEIAPAIAITPITPFIDAANTIANDINTRCGKSFNEDRLTQIELYLSAHFVYMAEGTSGGTKRSESIARGDYQVTYAVATLGEGIKGTTYGQTANLLSEGCLIEWDKRQSQIVMAGPNDC